MIYPKTEHYMEFENPTASVFGIYRSVQGFSVWKDYAFVLYHSGICAVYDLLERNESPLDVFKLASYHGGEDDKRFANHANDLMIVEGERGKPLMYITAGNSGDLDENGCYITYCAVEEIDITMDEEKRPHFSTRLVQSIYYRLEGIEQTPYQNPGWGWPASMVDTDRGEYVMLSARYRTTKDFVDKYNENNYIITRFPLPKISPENETVVLTPTDILGQFEVPFDVLITQGGTIRDSRIYYTFGFGGIGTPSAMRVYDLKTEKTVARLDFSFTPFGGREIECCAFYNGKLLINVQSSKIEQIGSIYAIDPAVLIEEAE